MRVLLDAGHGGVAFGVYSTPGKRSPFVPPGIYEGEFNRDMCARISDALVTRGIDEVEELNPGPINIPLSTRRQYLNDLVERLAPAAAQDVILLSVHANAAGNKRQWYPRARGHVIFIPPFRGASAKDTCLTRVSEAIDERLQRVTGHTRGVKRANFAILKVDCPAVLVEYGFMTHAEEAEYLADPVYRQGLAVATAEALVEVDKLYKTE